MTYSFPPARQSGDIVSTFCSPEPVLRFSALLFITLSFISPDFSSVLYSSLLIDRNVLLKSLQLINSVMGKILEDSEPEREGCHAVFLQMLQSEEGIEPPY